MNPTRERRQGSIDQDAPDAVQRRCERSTPTAEQALAAIGTILAYFAGARQPKIFTQHDLPPDAKSKDSYERRHRELRRAHVEGAWRRGKTLACTEAAWATELAASRPKLAAVVSSDDDDDQLDIALGIRTRLRPKQ